MNIGIFSLETINNAGDEILGETTQWLVHQNADKINVRRIQFSPDKHLLIGKYPVQLFLCKIIRIFADIFPQGNFKYKLLNAAYKIKLSRYYHDEMKQLDGVITAIGMLKFTTQNFSYLYDLLLKEAGMLRLPVMISAASIAEKNDEDWRCEQLKEVVKNPSLKIITTRDGRQGLERLKKEYPVRSDVFCDYVGDPALWIPEVYNVRKADGKRCIGINVIRSNIYLSYGGHTSEDEMFDFYVKMISALYKKGESFKLFCNGITDDYEVGKKILQRLNLSDDYLCPKPENAKQFFSVISQFDIVFGARLHACLSSYALDIPVIGLLWDDKLRFFSDNAGIKNYFLEENQLIGEKAAELLINSRKYIYDHNIRDHYKNRTKESIGKFLNEYL